MGVGNSQRLEHLKYFSNECDLSGHVCKGYWEMVECEEWDVMCLWCSGHTLLTSRSLNNL